MASFMHSFGNYPSLFLICGKMKNLLLSQKEYFAFVKSTLMYVLVHIFNKYHFVHTLWKLQKLNQIYCTLTEKISSNQLFNNFFSKNVAFTKFTIVESHIFLFFLQKFRENNVFTNK